MTFDEQIISLIIGQFIVKRVHLRKYLNIDRVDRILLSGTNSNNKGIQQMIANIFQCEVWFTDINDSAA